MAIITNSECTEAEDRADGARGWGFNVSKYSLEMLESCTHNHELVSDEDDKLHVHVDRKHMGVGGYDSWSPNVDNEFLVNNGGELTLEMGVMFAPLYEEERGAHVYNMFLNDEKK